MTINCIFLQVCPDFSCFSWCRKITPWCGQPEYLFFLTRASGIGGRAERGPQLLSPPGKLCSLREGLDSLTKAVQILSSSVSVSVSGCHALS